MKTYYLAALMVLYSSCAEAQDPANSRCDLESVTLVECLLDYLGENQSSESAKALYVVDLRDGEEVPLAVSPTSLPSAGIYRFGLMGPHDDVFLFVKDEMSVRVLDDYAVNSVLDVLNRFLERSDLTENEQVEYLANIAAFLRIKQLRHQPVENDHRDLN